MKDTSEKSNLHQFSFVTQDYVAKKILDFNAEGENIYESSVEIEEIENNPKRKKVVFRTKNCGKTTAVTRLCNWIISSLTIN
jgi:hypothetical protein